MACRAVIGILTRGLSSSEYLCIVQHSALRVPHIINSTVPARHATGGHEVDWDSFGAWEDRIESPILLEQSIKHGIPIPTIALDTVGQASVQGRRPANEDRLCVRKLEENLLLFGLYDGHAGPLAADLAEQNLAGHVKTGLKQSTDLQNVLSKAFIQVNEELENFVEESKDPALTNTGTTATVCVLRNGNELVLANVGDSRALVCRKGKVIRLSRDHEPEYNAQEKDRIIKCGGYISWNSLGKPLVNGVLTMTRSIGDLPLKKYGVIAEPQTRSLEIFHRKDSFLVIVSDGVHFVMSDQEICDSIGNCHSPQEAADHIVDQALQFGSDDNASAIVVPFGQWGRFTNPNMTFSLRWHKL